MLEDKEIFPDLKRVDYNYTLTREQYIVLLYMQKNKIVNNMRALTIKSMYNGEMKDNLGGIKERTLYTYLSKLRNMGYVDNGYKVQKEQTYYITDKGLQKVALEVKLAGGDISWLDIKPRKSKPIKTKKSNNNNPMSEKDVVELIEQIEKECRESGIEEVKEDCEIEQKGEDKNVER